MQKRTFLHTAVAVAALGASGIALAQDNVFKIGLILPMTGQQATTGRQIEAAARLWMAQNGDTVAGKKVQLILKDDGSVPANTRRLAQELAVDKHRRCRAALPLGMFRHEGEEVGIADRSALDGEAVDRAAVSRDRFD